MRKLNSFILVFVVFSLFFVSSISAKEQDSMEPQMETKVESPKIKYDLAFPGILPDSPLYKLKVLRDKLSIFLISEPLKRIDYYLLQADKGILASAILIDKNKVKLAEETVLKAEHNMTLITYELKGLTQKPTDELFLKLETASLKHQEVLDSLIKRLPIQDQKTLKIVSDFSKVNLRTIKNLHSKKYYNQP